MTGYTLGVYNRRYKPKLRQTHFNNEHSTPCIMTRFTIIQADGVYPVPLPFHIYHTKET